MFIHCKKIANLIIPSTTSEIETILAAILLNVYRIMVISGVANKITTYMIREYGSLTPLLPFYDIPSFINQ